jgi:hypothetical protein
MRLIERVATGPPGLAPAGIALTKAQLLDAFQVRLGNSAFVLHLIAQERV